MAQSAGPEEPSSLLSALCRSLPDLPRPLTTLTLDTNGLLKRFDVFRQFQNGGIRRTGVSKWQKPSMMARRVEDLVFEGFLSHDPAQVDIQTPRDVLSGFNEALTTRVKADADADGWVKFGLTLCREAPDDWQAMSASTFFWSLYVDPYVNEDLSEESMLVIGNAFLFARWKEQLEYQFLGLLLPKHNNASEVLEQIKGYMTTSAQPHEAHVDFERFVEQVLSAQTLAINTELSTAQMRALLRMSPWSGLVPVMDALKKALGDFDPKTKKYKKKLRIASDLLKRRVTPFWYIEPTEEGYRHCMACHGHETKRMKEYRFRLGLLVQCVAPKTFEGEQQQQQQQKRLLSAAVQLVTQRDDIVVSYKGTLSKGLELLSREMLARTPSLQQVVDTQVPVLSKAAADFLSAVWHDLWHRIYESEWVRTLMLVGVASRGGLFLSHQRWFIRALASAVRLVLQELLFLL